MGNGERRYLEQKRPDAKAGQEEHQNEQDMVGSHGQDVREPDADIEGKCRKSGSVEINPVRPGLRVWPPLFRRRIFLVYPRQFAAKRRIHAAIRGAKFVFRMGIGLKRGHRADNHEAGHRGDEAQDHPHARSSIWSPTRHGPSCGEWFGPCTGRLAINTAIVTPAPSARKLRRGGSSFSGSISGPVAT